jgi:hypothetical protein
MISQLLGVEKAGLEVGAGRLEHCDAMLEVQQWISLDYGVSIEVPST